MHEIFYLKLDTRKHAPVPSFVITKEREKKASYNFKYLRSIIL